MEIRPDKADNPDMGRTGRPTTLGEGLTVVERVVALAVRGALDQAWSAQESARTLLEVTTDPGALRRARARVSEVVLTSPSIAGTHAIAALNLALAQLQEVTARIPAQRPEKDPGHGESEPHDLKVLELTGTPESRHEAALFVAANVCPEHAAVEGGRAMLLAQELLAQTVGQAVRAAHLTVTCTGHAVTVYVDLAAEHPALEGLQSGAPDLRLVQVLADDCGAEPLRPGVRYWATIET
jgi:hypothetical protein